MGAPLRRDPLGRDRGKRPQGKGDWSVEALAKYLKGVASQIEENLQKQQTPTAEKLDMFVERLVLITQRQTRHAPKKVQHMVVGMFTQRFKKFWNVTRNEKVRSTSPEELKGALSCLIDGLNSEFGVNPDLPARPLRPVRFGVHHSNKGRLP